MSLKQDSSSLLYEIKYALVSYFMTLVSGRSLRVCTNATSGKFISSFSPKSGNLIQVGFSTFQ